MRLILCILSLSVFAQPPGAINPDVTQDNIDQTICVAGWTKTVRPSTSFTNGYKKVLMERAGIDWSRAGEFELDHLVPLSLAGSPRQQDNLMLQPWDGVDGAKRKDRLERKLQRLVCTGHLPLAQAQQEIASDWRAAYGRYVGR